MKLLKCLLIAVPLLAIPVAACADNYPSRPIRLVVPFPPGGGTDILSRLVGSQLGDALKTAVVIENKPGAGGNIGVDVAAKSPHDGYTLVMGQTSNLAINPSLYRKLPYDPVRDLSPVTLVASSPVVLVVSANSPYKNLAQLVTVARANPGKLTFASPGNNGTVSHLAGELLQHEAGIKLQHVPYKGASQALMETIGGQVNMFMASVPSALSQVRAGKLRPIAVSSAKRIPELPDVPTVAESGYPRFEASTWYGLLVPAGTPAQVIARLNTEVNRILKQPAVHQKISLEGATVGGGSPQQFNALIHSELSKWGKVVKASGARID